MPDYRTCSGSVGGVKAIARCVGTSGRTISRWESGDSIPTFTIAQMKALDRLLRSNGKTLQDLPDQFAPVQDR